MFVTDFKHYRANGFAKYVRFWINWYGTYHEFFIPVKVDKNIDPIFANNPFALTGDEWKERRAEITPGLTNQRVGGMNMFF